MTRADSMFCQSWFQVFFAPRLASSLVCPTHTSPQSRYTPWTSSSYASLADLGICNVFLFGACILLILFVFSEVCLLMVWRNGIIFHNNAFLHLPYFSKLVSHTQFFFFIGNSPLRCRATVRKCIQIRPLPHWDPRSRFTGISEVTSRNQLLGHLKTHCSQSIGQLCYEPLTLGAEWARNARGHLSWNAVWWRAGMNRIAEQRALQFFYDCKIVYIHTYSNT
jgi:hypothetical protein